MITKNIFKQPFGDIESSEICRHKKAFFASKGQSIVAILCIAPCAGDFITEEYALWSVIVRGALSYTAKKEHIRCLDSPTVAETFKERAY